MVKDTEKVEEKSYSVNIKVSAKGEIYGEFTVKADTTEQLEQDLVKVRDIFFKQRMG